jgi:hypothetical protein
VSHRVNGRINIIFGGLGLVHQVRMFIFVYPRMDSFAKVFGGGASPLRSLNSFLVLGVIIISWAMVYIGEKLVLTKLNYQRFYKWGVGSFMTLVLVCVYYLAFSIMGSVVPIQSMWVN